MAGSTTFVWTEAQYAAALRAQVRLGVRKSTVIVIAVAALLGGTVAALPWLAAGPAGDRIGLTMIGGFCALFLPLCLASVSWHAPRTARRIFRQQPSLAEPVTVSWSPDGLQYQSRTGSSLHEWDKMHYWSRSRSTFLFAANERLHHIVPVDALGSAAADLEATAAASGAKRR